MVRKTRRTILIITLGLALLLLAPTWFAYRVGLLPRVDRIHTFHAPVFSPDGSDVYYLSRKAFGVSWGPGIEFFTPPAAIIVLADSFSLEKTNRITGETTTLYRWRVPHPLRPRTQYRNYLFELPQCELKWEGRILHYKIGLDFLPDNPPYMAVKEWCTGFWRAETNGVVEKDRWKAGYYEVYPWTDQTLWGQYEVINYRYLAIVINGQESGRATVLRVSDTAHVRSRDGIEKADLMQYSHRAGLERSRTIRETYSRIVAELKSQGTAEGEAMLQANTEMERLGYYPKSPKIVAHAIEAVPKGVKMFEISRDEFRFGLFPDIEKAISKAGTEVSFWGKYIRHRDFETSERLNEYLDRGNSSFVVKREGQLFLLTVTR